jgi:hypothetical protein
MRLKKEKQISRTLVLLAFLGLTGCKSDASDGYKFGWFFRMVVELSYGGEPLNIDVVIGCGTQARQILGEGRSARAIWAPYIFGVRTKTGEGVLVQTPSICLRDLAKQPMPDDFLPVVFWAPDASNLEFMVAYLNEQAYDQPVSKLKFHKATFSTATQADYDTWRQTEWKKNIVPIGDRKADHLEAKNFFIGRGFFPQGDLRNSPELYMRCHAYLRVPLTKEIQEAIRPYQPADNRRFWLLDRQVLWTLEAKHKDVLSGERRLNPQWDREMAGASPSFADAKGVNRASGIGHIEDRELWVASGRGLRIPYRVETGYPWASQGLVSRATIDVHIDTKNGADHGFAYCFRDMYAQYFVSVDPYFKALPTEKRFFIDDELVATSPAAPFSAHMTIVEYDRYLWLPDTFPFPLSHELARMQ